jgi:death-on-curing protein
MVVWIEKALVLGIHDRQLAEHGGQGGVRDDGLLESALARPQQLYAYGDPAPDLADLAAALAYGLARNHPFLDGNKRTAAVACETFLELNGATLEADDLDLYPVYLALAEGKLAEREFAAWLRERVRTRGRGAAHEPRAAYRAKPRAARTRRARLKRPRKKLVEFCSSGSPRSSESSWI